MGGVKFDFKGIIATAFTPFNPDSECSLNLTLVPKYAEYFASKKFGAILINGTYSEGPSMTVDERIEVAEAWSKAVASTKQKLIVQVGGTNLKDVKRLAKHAESVKASAILCLPELYYRASTAEELIDYLREVGKAAPTTPLFYYYSPDATGVRVKMTEFLEKVGDRIPTLAGIKFADTKLDELTQILSVSGDFKVIVANNYIIPACVSIGIDTFMPTSVNIAADLINDIYNSAIKGDFATAQKHQKKLAGFMNELARIGPVMPVMKAVTSHIIPFDVGPTRKPLKSFESSNDQVVISRLAVVLI